MFFDCSYDYFLLTGLFVVLVALLGGVCTFPDFIFDRNSPGLFENEVDIFRIPPKISGEFKPPKPYIKALYREFISNCSRMNQANREVIIAAIMFLTTLPVLVSSGEVEVTNRAIIPAAPISNTTHPPFKNAGINSFKFFKIFGFIQIYFLL
jgi:hypothetical protein